jgi:hypothetical protein
LSELKTKIAEEVPELEKLINDDISKYSDDFKISHTAKSSFSSQEIESAISDVLNKESQ